MRQLGQFGLLLGQQDRPVRQPERRRPADDLPGRVHRADGPRRQRDVPHVRAPLRIAALGRETEPQLFGVTRRPCGCADTDFTPGSAAAPP